MLGGKRSSTAGVGAIATAGFVFVPLVLLVTLTAFGSGAYATARNTVTVEAHTPSQLAYDLVASDGGIFDFGGAPFDGSTGGQPLNSPIVGMAVNPGGPGYWEVASDGGIFSFGGAAFEGSTGAIHLNKPIVGMAATTDGRGYWLVASDGGIFNFGDANFYGSAGATHLNSPIVGMAASSDGQGYWLVASDGGIFNYGSANFLGSTGAMHINKPIVGMAAASDGSGYWLVASDGGIFNYGTAPFLGSTGGQRLNKPIVGMAATTDGRGYWLVASDGGIFNYGNAAFSGSTGGTVLNKPVVGMAASPGQVVSYIAKVDSTYRQNPLNPLEVSYSYSGDAISTANGMTIDLASTGQLPGGILNLFSDGSLACSIEVGGATTGGNCPVTYTSYGDHNIVVQYLSAADAQTTPATYDIQPAPPPIVSHVAGDPYIVSPGSNASAQWDSIFCVACNGGSAESYFDWYSPTFTVRDAVTGQDVTSAVGSPVVLLTVTNADQSTYASAGVVLSENPLGPGNLHEQGVYALADCEPATPIQCNSIDPPPSNPFTSAISTEPGVNVTDPSPNVTYGGATGDQEFEVYTTHTIVVGSPVVQSITYTPAS